MGVGFKTEPLTCTINCNKISEMFKYFFVFCFLVKINANKRQETGCFWFMGSTHREVPSKVKLPNLSNLKPKNHLKTILLSSLLPVLKSKNDLFCFTCGCKSIVKRLQQLIANSIEVSHIVA